MSEHPQTIATEYKQAGHVMRLVKREGMAAMYHSVDGSYWEVHRIRVSPAESIRGRAYPEREILAGNEAFGEFGWACVSQERADSRFSEAIAANAISEAKA
jgi:hypothetical protein